MADRKEGAYFLLEPAMRERLTELSIRYRVSRSVIVRETLDACLSRWEQHRLSGIPIEWQNDIWLGPDEPTGDDR